MRVVFAAIDREQPELPLKVSDLATVPFPGEEVVLGDTGVEVRVIRRQFFTGPGQYTQDQYVKLFVRVLPPQGEP